MTNKDDQTNIMSQKSNKETVADVMPVSEPTIDVVAEKTSDTLESVNKPLDPTLCVSTISTSELTKPSMAHDSNSDPTIIANHAMNLSVAHKYDLTRKLTQGVANESQEEPTTVLTHSSGITNKAIFDSEQQKSEQQKSPDQQVVSGGVIKDRFILEECLGYGGMGVVYKARDIRKEEMDDDSSYIAIKFLNEELQDQKEALISLQREAKKSQALAHPNIVTVYDFDRDDGLVFLSMEYLDGKTLEELIITRYCKRLPVAKVMHLIELIARALAYSHQQGFVHADLKPSNVFLTKDGNIKVLDFGIAQAVRLKNGCSALEGSQFDSYTLGGITPNFASPEMLNNQAPTPSDDIYSLGCVAYALLAGQHPFTDAKGRKVTAKYAQENNMEVQTISSISRRHMRAIRRCLAFDGGKRFQNAGEFIDAIKPPPKLRRRVTALLATLVLVVCVSWWFIVKESTVIVGLNDLPVSMSELVETIELGDISFKNDDIDQAHKLYSHAWETSHTLNYVAPRDQLKLKVIIDRRINTIIRYLIAESQKKNNTEFQLLQLQIALEFLKQGDVGTLDDKIDQALVEIGDKLSLIPVD